MRATDQAEGRAVVAPASNGAAEVGWNISGADDRDPGTFWTTRRAGLALFAVLLVAVALVTLHVHTYTLISPIDEFQHIDYALKLSDGELVRQGDKVGEETMREEACRGVDANFPVPPVCDRGSPDPEQFQEAGYNTAAPHPPGYYAVAGTMARLLDPLPGVNSPVTGARLAGSLWLAAALALMWLILQDLGVSVAARIPVLLLIGAAPTVLHASATVNPDGSSVAVGAAVLLAVLRWEAGRARPWVLAVVAALAVLTKATNATAVVLAGLYLCVRWLQARRAPTEPETAPGDPDLDAIAGDGVQGAGAGTHRREGAVAAPPRGTSRRVVTALGSLGAALVVVAGAWLVLSPVNTRVDLDTIPMSQRFRVESVTADNFVDNVPAGLSPLRDPYLPQAIASPATRLSGFLGDRLLLAGVLASLAISLRGTRERALAAASAIAMVGLGPGFVVFDFVATNSYFVIPPRYGLAIVPAAAAATGLALQRSRAGLIAGYLVAAFGLTAMLSALL